MKLKLKSILIVLCTIFGNAKLDGLNDSESKELQYKYGYEIQGNENSKHGHSEQGNGNYSKGEYYVSLSDGNAEQNVEYYADGNGYHPKVSYRSDNSFAKFVINDQLERTTENRPVIDDTDKINTELKEEERTENTATNESHEQDTTEISSSMEKVRSEGETKKDEIYYKPEQNEISEEFVSVMPAWYPNRLLKPIIVTDFTGNTQATTESNDTISESESNNIIRVVLRNTDDSNIQESEIPETPVKEIESNAIQNASNVESEIEPQTLQEQSVYTTTFDIQKSIPLMEINLIPEIPGNYINENLSKQTEVNEKVIVHPHPFPYLFEIPLKSYPPIFYSTPPFQHLQYILQTPVNKNSEIINIQPATTETAQNNNQNHQNSEKYSKVLRFVSKNPGKKEEVIRRVPANQYESRYTIKRKISSPQNVHYNRKTAPFVPSIPLWDSIYPPQHTYYVPVYIPGQYHRASRRNHQLRQLIIEYGGFKPPIIPSTVINDDSNSNQLNN